MNELANESSSTKELDCRLAEAEPSHQSPPAPTTRPEVAVNDSRAVVCYANFARVTGTPEELILDFGLNAQPIGIAGNVEVKQRLVVNYFTAKRLLNALAISVQRHEQVFGALETDVQKRVSPGLRRQG